MAPWLIDNSSFGTSKSVSTSNLMPNPLQSGHAPIGELKEKSRGSNLGIVNPHSLQA